EFIDRCDAGLERAARPGAAAASGGDPAQDRQSDEASDPAGDATVLDAIARARDRLQEIRKGIEMAPSIDPEGLERDLDAIDGMILSTLRGACAPSELSAMTKEAKSHLRKYRKKMDQSIYDQTVENFIARRLRETFRIPRLSLFFLG